jgi:hypothetical protein
VNQQPPVHHHPSIGSLCYDTIGDETQLNSVNDKFHLGKVTMVTNRIGPIGRLVHR